MNDSVRAQKRIKFRKSSFKITRECKASLMGSFHEHITFSAFTKINSFMYVYNCSTGNGNLYTF